MRVADVIADRLFELGIRHVFMITGGGAMHLNDAFGKHHGLRLPDDFWTVCHLKY